VATITGVFFFFLRIKVIILIAMELGTYTSDNPSIAHTCWSIMSLRKTQR
jgi:hypothetical protein